MLRPRFSWILCAQAVSVPRKASLMTNYANSCPPKFCMWMHVVLTQADPKALPDKRALGEDCAAMMTTKHANICPPTISVWIHRVLTSDADRWMA